ncbi:MAG: polyprenyl diphosphate synthase [bacterium]
MTLSSPLRHLAVIMDGNRRWAKARGLFSVEGHRQGVKTLKALVQECLSLGVDYLTAYAFSSENWKRTAKELDFLFELLKESAIDELSSLNEQGVRVKFLGDLSVFKNTSLLDALINLEKATQYNSRLVFNIALNYGAVAELTRAVNAIAESLSEEEIRGLDENSFKEYLYTADIPDPDIIVRTGGKHRLSNYLLWQAAYSKLIFTDTLWPDFKLDDIKSQLNILVSRL